jgi:Glucose / Sorbosone dehydrogenase
VGILQLAAASSASGFDLDQIGDPGTYEEPVYVTSDPSDHNRLFIVQRDGLIKLTRGEQTSTFLDLTSSSILRFTPNFEDGLLSMAFAPDFAQTGRFYVAYTGSEDTATADLGDLHVDQFTAAGNSAELSSRREVLIVPEDPNFPFGGEMVFGHFGGQLQFGPDGYLYLSTGDGGPQEDTLNHAQSPTDLRGKLLRINPLPGGGYTNPSGNPFVGVAGRDEVWSLGLRNPWRFSFDRATGALTIGDVGDEFWEEVDYEPQSAGGGRGRNFGWNCREGANDTGFGHGPCDGPFRDPVLEYPHVNEPCDSITGGYVVRDPGLEELQGRYVYAEHCTGELRSAVLSRPSASGDRSENTLAPARPTSFGEDSCGRIYVAALNGALDSVHRLQDSTPTTAAQCAPPPPPPPPPRGDGDAAAPALVLGGKDKQSLARSRRIRLRFTSDEDATLEIEGEIEAEAERPAASARARRFGLAGKDVALEAGVRRKVSWRLGKRRTKRLRGLLRRGGNAKALFTYTATDQGGNRTDGERRVRLTYR